MSNRTRTATRSGPRIDDLHEVARALEAALGEAESVKLAWRAQTSVEVGEGDAEQLLKLVDTLEEDDDVQTVWGNYEMSDDGAGEALAAVILIIGLDPGLGCTGWGVIAAEGNRLSHVANGQVRTDPKQALPARLVRLDEALGAVIDAHGPPRPRSRRCSSTTIRNRR